jgi:hypothetical protein
MRRTPSERAWLADVEREWAATTPGRWHAHASDDELFSTARYVSTQPPRREQEFVHDNRRALFAGSQDQADPEQVVAITLLQNPALAEADQCDPNTLFIAHVHQQLPRLLAVIRRLDDALATQADNPR